jgi:hypothetical protein
MTDNNHDKLISDDAVNDEATRKAYLFVAQSVAIAVQDAVDNLRNINAICNTVIGAAMAQGLEDPDGAPQFQPIISLAREISLEATSSFLNIGNNAAKILNNFPSGK